MTLRNPTSSHVQSLARHRILVVEDEYFLADDIINALRQHGADIVGPAGEVGDGLRCLAGVAVDAAILDVSLRGEYIYPLASELKLRGIPFIFTTGYDKKAIPAEYVSIPLCEKPLDLAVLIETLVNLLASEARKRSSAPS